MTQLVRAQTCYLPTPTPHEQFLEPSTPVASGAFGNAIAVDGNVLAVAEFGQNAVRVFERPGSSWIEVAYLNDLNLSGDHAFGEDVAVSGNTIAVGVRGDPNLQGGGAVYIYERDSNGIWQEQQILQSSSPSSYYFGGSVALNGTTLLVGSRYHKNAQGTTVGLVFVYVRDQNGSWIPTATLTASNGEDLDSFGTSVDLNGNTAVVGAIGEDSSATGVNGDQNSNSSSNAGATYVFRETQAGWVQEAYLKAGQGSAGFGNSVAIHGDRIVVGAPAENPYGAGQASYPYPGNAHVFDRVGTTWSPRESLAQVVNTSGLFGISVDISSRGILVGARSDDSQGAVDCGYLPWVQGHSGAGYYFEEDAAGNFHVIDYLKGINAVPNHNPVGDVLGNSAALDETHAYLGANGFSDSIGGTSSSGAAYVFHVGSQPQIPACVVPPPIGQQQSLRASHPGVTQFGEVTDIDGDILVAGAPSPDQLSNFGWAFVFERNGDIWSEVASLQGSPDTRVNDVAVSGNTIAVGQSFEVYIHERNASGIWQEQQILGNSPNNFIYGSSLALEGDTLVVNGSIYNQEIIFVVFVYRRDLNGIWNRTATLYPSITETADNFGESIAIHGSTIVVGASDESSSATGVNGNPNSNASLSSGAAYVFRESQGIWTQEAYLKAGTNQENSGFGEAVAIHGDRIVVGASREDYQPPSLALRENAGNAYVFERVGSTWTLTDDLRVYNYQWDLFGASVAISSQGILIGAPWENGFHAFDCGHIASADQNSGAGFYFEQDAAGIFNLTRHFKAVKTANPPFGIQVGRSAALDESHAYLGAIPDANGAVYVFPLDGTQPGTSRFDWDDDGSTDLFIQHDDGRLAVWYYDAGQYAGGQLLSASQPDPDTKVMGHSDVNGDGQEDIIWQALDGQINVWYMDGITKLGESPTIVGAYPTWRIVGINDFNQDGSDDLLLQQQVDGRLVIWYMDGVTYIGYDFVSSPSGTDWRVKAATDMNCDGHPDLIWQKTSTGQIAVWEMNGHVVTGAALAPAPSAVWELESVQDVNKDGSADFVFRHKTNGTIFAWYLDGTTFITSVSMLGTSNSWEIRHSGN